MSHKTIDKFLENFDTCGKIMITGGEPLLCLDEIEYLIKGINDNDKVVGVIEITTNASILDPRIINIYSEFVSKDEERLAYLRISNDPFHDINQSKKAYDFYSNLTTDYHNIIVLYELSEGETMPELRFTGRAKNMLTDINKYLPYVDHLNAELKTPHRIRIQDNKVSCALCVYPNGGVGLGDEISFYTEDSQVLGNITDESLVTIINSHNDTCLLSCCDSFNIDKKRCLEILFIPELHGFLKKEIECRFDNSEYELFVVYATTFIGKFILERLYALRKQAKERFPLLTPEEIIANIPMPYDISEYIITKADYIVKNSTTIGPDIAKKYTDDYTMRLYRSAFNEIKNNKEFDHVGKKKVINMLNNLLIFYTLTCYPNTIFTEDALWGFDDIRLLTRIYIKLKSLNAAHESGEIPPKNDGVLLCMEDKTEEVKKLDRAGEADFLMYTDAFIDEYLGFSPFLNKLIKRSFSKIWANAKVEGLKQTPGALPFDEAI